MITVDEAILKIRENTGGKVEERILVEDACGYSLAEDVFSPINMPPFNQSAMDGYAVVANGNSSFNLIGEVKAGDDQLLVVKEGEAIRIFTGAMIPDGANAVIRQEDVERIENTIKVEKEIQEGANIRLLGEQITKGVCAIEKGTQLTPGAIGFLSMLGYLDVLVYAKPKVTVIVTGNELMKPGETLELGKIYESNSTMLSAAMSQLGISVELRSVKDDYQSTVEVIDKAIKEMDLVIMTGGISVGYYDFVGDALKELEVKEHFYKVKQKPGKPLFYGTKEGKSIFALPGNPGAVLSCFYAYVLPCVYQLMGRNGVNTTISGRLTADYKKTAKLTHFLKARILEGKVEILTGQSSAMLNSFVTANCIAKLESGREEWSEGDEISVIPLI
jgi:molybdopterin molybdotransferase